MQSLRLWAVLLTVMTATGTGQPTQESAESDAFDRLARINKASIVMLVETELVPPSLARTIAAGIRRVIEDAAKPGALRSGDYLHFEAALLRAAGRDASRLHTGRSRQDIGSTSRRIALRHDVLRAYEAHLAARRALLTLARKHLKTIIPAYTHGVQAQPTTLAHYLLAFAAALDRDGARLREAFVRVNRSPLGAAALGTSSFPIDRPRLASLLGFDSVIENSYDANLLASADSKIEIAAVLSISAVHVGQFVQNIHTLYSDPKPWIRLAREKTSSSSIMPQKRNPRPLDRLRTSATRVVGGAQTVTLHAHNTNTGMHDYRDASAILDVTREATQMYRSYADVVAHLEIDIERALREVDDDYSTMTEVADVLLRKAGVAFRVGHHYASMLTDYGRAKGKRPCDLTPEELARIYREANGAALPVPVKAIQEALDPAAMVLGRRGLGGPQLAETERMLAAHDRALKASAAWLAAARNRLTAAQKRLDSAFERLRS